MKKLKEINNNNQLKGILFFGFYFIFFLIVIILIRVNNKNINNKKIINDDWFIASEYNYSFNYIITQDDIEYKYSGDKIGNKEKFEFNGNSYSFDGLKYYSFQNNSWVEVDNPYMYKELLDYKKIILLNNNMMLTNTIKYASGRIVNHYIVSSNSINKVLFNKDTDFLENGNNVSISKNKIGNIEKISLKLDDFCKNNGLCNRNLKIDLEYEYYSDYEDIITK